MTAKDARGAVAYDGTAALKMTAPEAPTKKHRFLRRKPAGKVKKAEKIEKTETAERSGLSWLAKSGQWTVPGAILAIAAGTQFTRWLPFWLFPEKKDPPAVVLYLGKVLPPAMMGLLVVYCLRSVSWLSVPHGAPELIAIAAVAGLHLWKRNVLLSIAGGTVLYMVLVQAVFV